VIIGMWRINYIGYWILDAAFREDESRLRKGDGAEIFQF
jgi:predicted transposase YbfD/YdcC